MTSCADSDATLPDAAIDPVAVEPVALACTGPLFYQPAQYNIGSTTPNGFGVSQQGEWNKIRAAADALLTRPSTITAYSTYRLYWPYLQPPPHGVGSSLNVGSSTTEHAWARRPLTVTLPSAYLIEFDYFYPNPAEQSGFRVFSAYDDNLANYTGVMIQQTGNQLSTNSHANIATITANAWHQFALYINANGTYDLYVDGAKRVSGGARLPGAITAIGFLGDTSTVTHNGQGKWDNFRISAGPNILVQDLFDGAALSTAWLTRESTPGAVALSSASPYDVANYPYWIQISREIEKRLRLVSFAYAVTGESKYLAFAKPIMQSLCGVGGNGWTTWGDPNYSGGAMLLSGPTLATGVAYALDALGPALTANEKLYFANCLHSRAIAPLTDEVSLDNDPTTWPNGFAVRYAGLGMAALAASCQRDESAALAQARTGLATLYDGMDVDGGYIEGMTYGAYAYDNSVTFHYFDRKITGTNGFTHPYLAKLTQFITHMLVPSRTAYVNFADSSSGAEKFATTLSILYDQRSDPYALAQLGRTAWQPQQPLNLELFSAVSSAPPVAGEPTGRSFREIGWGALRTSWADDATFVAMHSGPKTGHSHRDENGIVVWKDGNWLARDPGYQDYTAGLGHDFSYGSLGHNVVRVTTAGHPSIDQAHAGGALTAFYSAPSGGGYMQGDATAAYAPELTSMRRTVALLTASQCTVTTDVMTNGAATSTVDFVLHPEATNATASGNRFVVTKGTTNTANVDVFRLGPAPTLSVTQRDPWMQTDPTATLKATMNVAANATNTITATVCPPPTTWRSYSAGVGAAALIARINGVSTNVVEVNPASSVPLFALEVDASVDVGTAGDDSIAAHSPGISMYWDEWDPPTIESGLTVRRAQAAGANFLVNLTAADTVPREIALLYKAPANLKIRQYSGSAFHTVAELVGDNTWRVVRFHARAPYFDYRPDAGVQVLFDLSAPITVSELLLENELDADLCDVGTPGDSTTAQHSPGVSVYPDEWGPPMLVGGYTARRGPPSSNLYVNVSSANASYDVELVYRAPADLDLMQWTGSSYVTLARLKGDGLTHRSRISLRRPYFDYNGAGSDARINVQLAFGGTIDLFEVVGRGMR
ncbi:MAG: heparinase II/III family protein [Kofleriaceae bacterium]